MRKRNFYLRFCCYQCLTYPRKCLCFNNLEFLQCQCSISAIYGYNLPVGASFGFNCHFYVSNEPRRMNSSPSAQCSCAAMCPQSETTYVCRLICQLAQYLKRRRSPRLLAVHGELISFYGSLVSNSDWPPVKHFSNYN